MIGRAGVGVDNVDVDAATRRGIVVANAPESTVVSAAEHTIGLLVALARNIPQAHAALKQGRWERKELRRHRARGQDARRARLRPDRPAGRAPRRSASACASSPTTRSSPPSASASSASSGSRRRRASTPPPSSSRCICRSRRRRAARSTRPRSRRCATACGSSTPRAASWSTRRARSTRSRAARSAGAALDVFSEEPYSGPLLELDNVVVTPHLAASTDEAQDRAGVIVAEQVVAALDGGLVTNAVNIPVIGAEELEALGPYIPLAAKLGRIAMELAGGRADEIVVTTYGGLAELRHAPAHGRRAERRVPGPRRPARQLRQRAARSRASAASRCGRSGRSRRATTRTSCASRSATASEETRVAGTMIGSDDRQWLVQRARLRPRARARAAARPLPLRRRAGRDRPRRHAVRRGRRQHREHDRVAHAPRRQGADGADRRLDAAARARASASVPRDSTTRASSSSARR